MLANNCLKSGNNEPLCKRDRVHNSREREMNRSIEFEKAEREICDTGQIYDRFMTEEKSTVEEREYDVERTGSKFTRS